MTRPEVLDWLLEPEQPSVRYLALTQLLGKRPSDSEVRETKARIPSAGWAAEILGLNRNTLRKKIRELDIPVVRGLR